MENMAADIIAMIAVVVAAVAEREGAAVAVVTGEPRAEREEAAVAAEGTDGS